MGNFCGTGSASVNVTEIEKPSFELGPDLVFCPGEIWRLGAPLQQGEILWSDGTSEEFLPIDSPGIYWLQISNEGCAVRDSVVVEYDDCIGIEENGSNSLIIWPNPTTGQLHINLPVKQDWHMQLLDITGRQVSPWQACQGKLDLGSYDDGTYILLLRTQHAVYEKRLVKDCGY